VKTTGNLMNCSVVGFTNEYSPGPTTALPLFMRGAQSVSQPLTLTSMLLAGDGDYLGGRQRSNTWSALTKLGELS
jgi:hypothetical protein